MTLAIYAKKCGIEETELRQDAYSLLLPYDEMSIEEVNRFTREDVEAALSMFNEDYVTFPRDDIARLSGMPMPVNKRNWRKRIEHLCSDYWRGESGRPAVNVCPPQDSLYPASSQSRPPETPA